MYELTSFALSLIFPSLKAWGIYSSNKSSQTLPTHEEWEMLADKLGKIYTIKEGDTLSEICKELTGNGSKPYYEMVAKKLKINNPDIIIVGQILNLNIVAK
jgi:hypothetical protein